MPLTKRQKEVLDYLVAFETKHGYAPSFEEIGKGMKLTSLATVHKHITTLEKKGFIRRGYNQSRSIEIVQLPKPVKEQVIERKVQELPLVGRIAAGRPLEAIEERETLSLGDFARGGNSYVLEVKGSSMIEDHIMDGDYVVCEQTQWPMPATSWWRWWAAKKRRSNGFTAMFLEKYGCSLPIRTWLPSSFPQTR